MIPFVRLFPNGKRSVTEIHRPRAVEMIAERFILAGGRYCVGILDDGRVKLVAALNINGETREIASKETDNGPEMLDAVDDLVTDSVKEIAFAEAQ